MEIKDCIKEPLDRPVSICFTKSDFDELNLVRERLKAVNKNALLSTLMRNKIIELIKEVKEKLLNDV